MTERAPAEFRVLYRRHIGLVWRALRRFGVEDAQLDDAAQEVFVVFHRRMSQLEPERTAGFLYETSRRVAANLARGLSRRERRESAASGTDAIGNAEEALRRNEAVRVIEDFLATLAADQRAAFELVDLEGLTLREAAELLRENADTIATRVRRARARFRLYLAERDEGDGEHA